VQWNFSEFGFGTTPGSPESVSFSGATTPGNIICVHCLALTNSGTTNCTFTTPSDGHNTDSACTGAVVADPPSGGSAAAFYSKTTVGLAANAPISLPYTSPPANDSFVFFCFEIAGCTGYDNGGQGNSNGNGGLTTQTVNPFTTSTADLIVVTSIPQNLVTLGTTGYTVLELATPVNGGFAEYKTPVSAGSQSPTTTQSAGYFAILATAFTILASTFTTDPPHVVGGNAVC
jgi:hypothetical protein